MIDVTGAATEGSAPRRADVRRNEGALLDAAAAVFATSGVDAPVREIAAAAGVGIGTFYRHFPNRADLVVAVYRHQIEECAHAGPALLEGAPSPLAAVHQWLLKFMDFLRTKHGLADVMRGGSDEFSALHMLIVDRLVPALADLLDAARAAGEVKADVGAYEVIRAVGDLCAWDVADPGYDVRRIVALLVGGLQVAPPTGFEPVLPP